MHRAAAILACLLVAGAARAAEHFACACGAGADPDCQPGSDTATGDSPGTAWLSYDRAQDAFAGLGPGDAILFCRGGVFAVAGSHRWVAPGCQAANPCTVGAYAPTWGSGEENRPRFEQSAAGHAFDLADPSPADHEEGYVFRDLELVCTSGCGNDDFGFRLYNDVDDVALEGLRISGFGVGVRLDISDACGGGPPCDARNSRFVLARSEIVDNLAQGFLGSGDDAVIVGNLFDGNGVGGPYEHNLYWSGNGLATSGGRILDNELVRASVGPSGGCEGASLVAHGEHDDLEIVGNLIHEDGPVDPGCWGIDATPGGSSAVDAFTGLIIRGNVVRNMGNLGIGVATCADCTIEDNVVIAEQTLAGGTTLIVAPAPGTPHGVEDGLLDHLVVRNNTLYASASGGALGIRITSDGGGGGGHRVIGNAMRYAGTGGWSCLDADLASVTYDAIDHQVCGYVDEPGRNWEMGTGTLAAWQAASGFDLASLAADPGFASPAAPLWDLTAASAASPMVDHGDSAAGSPVDFFGNERPALPDAGAYELGLGGPPRLFADGFESGGTGRWVS
jgi:hypothetical protein